MTDEEFVKSIYPNATIIKTIRGGYECISPIAGEFHYLLGTRYNITPEMAWGDGARGIRKKLEFKLSQ